MPATRITIKRDSRGRVTKVRIPRSWLDFRFSDELDRFDKGRKERAAVGTVELLYGGATVGHPNTAIRGVAAGVTAAMEAMRRTLHKDTVNSLSRLVQLAKRQKMGVFAPDAQRRLKALLSEDDLQRLSHGGLPLLDKNAVIITAEAGKHRGNVVRGKELLAKGKIITRFPLWLK